jgi:hypothetical protein
LIKINLGKAMAEANSTRNTAGEPPSLQIARANEWRRADKQQRVLQDKLMCQLISVTESSKVASHYRGSDIEELFFGSDAVKRAQYRKDLLGAKKALGLSPRSFGGGGGRKLSAADRRRLKNGRKKTSRIGDTLNADGKPGCRHPGCKGTWDGRTGCSIALCPRKPPKRH